MGYVHTYILEYRRTSKQGAKFKTVIDKVHVVLAKLNLNPKANILMHTNNNDQLLPQ